ncbi:hypothetical protein CFC21_080981 [Triticum aestivum]|uniref:Protein kinase domain-containing protein n=2 Tax=Triticum aestivum TaxID=4565 RepID=A0A3B6N2I6_WHEAT|nr:hypothetical protein CFC21_080981 [Triticum aestivum]
MDESIGSIRGGHATKTSEIAVECMNLDPEKRPDACHIIDRLDKIEGTDKEDETGTNSSIIELQLSLPREQYAERVGKPAAESLQVDVGEHSEILENGTDSLELRHSQEGLQKLDELSICGVQETKQKVKHRGTSISSSISSVFYKLNSLNIFNKKASRNLHHTLEKSHNVKIFRKEELRPIMRSTNLIGRGGFGKVYKGVVDNTLVVVKPISCSSLGNVAYENYVIGMCQVSHKNIARPIGCCLEADTTILVYELISNGSVDGILHDGNRTALNLDVRLNIIAESAQGLAYLHSQAHTKILHGDLKPENILLDDNFIPKISDFGISPLIARYNEHTTNIIGDMTYMDPVYLQTGRLTEKSDVYSFGVVILEVISRKKATHSEHNSLVKSFLEVHKEGKKATELFDKEIAVTAGDFEILDRLAEIAVECINLDVDQRPTMTDVEDRLLMLNRSS